MARRWSLRRDGKEPLSGTTPAAWRLVVWEVEPYWVIRLRQYFVWQCRLPAASRQVVWAPSVEQVFEELQGYPTAATCWVVPAARAVLVAEQLMRQRRDFPTSLPLAVGPGVAPPWKSLLAVSGAAWLGETVAELPQLGRLVARHAALAPISPRPWWHNATETLPWDDWFVDQPWSLERPITI